MFQIWKSYIITTINPRSQCLEQERKNYFASLLIWRQNHSKLSKYMQPINMIMIYYWDQKLKKIKLHVLKTDIITIKNTEWMFLAQRMIFFTGRDQYDRYCVWLSYKLLSLSVSFLSPNNKYYFTTSFSHLL